MRRITQTIHNGNYLLKSFTIIKSIALSLKEFLFSFLPQRSTNGYLQCQTNSF